MVTGGGILIWLHRSRQGGERKMRRELAEREEREFFIWKRCMWPTQDENGRASERASIGNKKALLWILDFGFCFILGLSYIITSHHVTTSFISPDRYIIIAHIPYHTRRKDTWRQQKSSGFGFSHLHFRVEGNIGWHTLHYWLLLILFVLLILGWETRGNGPSVVN